MTINNILLQAQGGQGGSGMLWMLILLFVIMYLLMIRPQQKQAKKEKQFRESLKKGDRVSFSGGIYGKVHEVAEHTVDVEKNMVQPVPEQAAPKK